MKWLSLLLLALLASCEQRIRPQDCKNCKLVGARIVHIQDPSRSSILATFVVDEHGHTGKFREEVFGAVGDQVKVYCCFGNITGKQ